MEKVRWSTTSDQVQQPDSRNVYRVQRQKRRHVSKYTTTTPEDKADFERGEFAAWRFQAHPDRSVEDLQVVDVDGGERHRKRLTSMGTAQL